MLKISPKNNKVLFFSDLHLGVHQNSQSWHKICLDVAQWIGQVMKEKKLDTIFFAGDVFHDRHEIGVSTLHTAKKFFNYLKDYNIHLIPGNHDAFLSSTVEINSVEILENNNVFVHSKPTTIQVEDKKVTFCPWKTDVSQLESVDMLVGHFEIKNFKMTATKICDHGESAEMLLSKAKATITGHFHTRDHRVYEDGYILYLGSPHEMDFGDRGQQKGVSIIDFENFDIEFVENNITPKHFRLQIQDLIDKKFQDLPSLVKNNIVSIYVDQKVDNVILDTLNTKLTQYGPLQFRTEFNILDEAQADIKDTKRMSIDIETAFEEFIDQVETRATKKEVLDKCLEIYKLSQQVHE